MTVSPDVDPSGRHGAAQANAPAAIEDPAETEPPAEVPVLAVTLRPSKPKQESTAAPSKTDVADGRTPSSSEEPAEQEAGIESTGGPILPPPPPAVAAGGGTARPGKDSGAATKTAEAFDAELAGSNLELAKGALAGFDAVPLSRTPAATEESADANRKEGDEMRTGVQRTDAAQAARGPSPTESSKVLALKATSHWTGPPPKPGGTERFALDRLAFCTEVMGFGQFESAAPDSLRPGREALLYAEIAGFGSREVDGFFETCLSSLITLETTSGQVVAPVEFKDVVDRCQSRRHDFFCHYTFMLPPDLAAGSYVLRLTVKDLISDETAERTLDLVVAPAKP